MYSIKYDMQISKALNYQHDQSFAEKPVVHDLLR